MYSFSTIYTFLKQVFTAGIKINVPPTWPLRKTDNKMVNLTHENNSFFSSHCTCISPACVYCNVGTQKTKENERPEVFKVFPLSTQCVCALPHLALNVSASRLPIMHCEKGHAHFIYLEETRHEIYQAQRGGRNITWKNPERTRERVCILFVFIRYDECVSFLVSVDFGDTLVSSLHTLEFV